MTAASLDFPADGPVVPKTADGIAAALSPARRMEFYRQLGTAPLGQVEAVLRRWWCEAVLDADPRAEHVYHAAISGNLAKTTLDEITARRAERQGG
ncbi:hypothetical protein [Nonomuraea ceibae]|uniref:hypothetical protein n=1 Tax=Nonomuraea ceibae TaxID=1935170 RepID=UPI001C5D693A|nr:hypothetical protein [Nonomuraea ceibae]